MLTSRQRWDFPGKHNPAHKNPALVARLQELWQQNYTQKDMVDTLHDEGFPINDRELIRLRLRLKLLLRESRSKSQRKQTADGRVQKKAKKRPQVFPRSGLINQLGNAILAEESSSEESEEEDIVEQSQAPVERDEETDLQSVEESIRKQLRYEKLQNESDEKWRTRKRRRRTRGWAGLPADAFGEPPRFPSETTIDEAKAHLSLDNGTYRKLRQRFFDVCKAEGVIKKTIAGPEKWAQIVQQLIQEDTHLSGVFLSEPEVLEGHDALFRPKGQKALSLDVICMDVTKRLRTMDSRMTLADAKNMLGLNPEQTRHARSAFAAKLKVDHFTNKHEAGEQHWADLKTAWVNESQELARALEQGEADPEYATKLKAIEVLARDVMKRQQQEKTAKDPNRKKQVHHGPGPGPAPPVVAPHPTNIRRRSQHDAHASIAALNTTHATYNNLIALAESADTQIDPSLLLAANDAAILPTQTYQPENHYSQQHYHAHPYRQAKNGYTSHVHMYDCHVEAYPESEHGSFNRSFGICDGLENAGLDGGATHLVQTRL